MTALGSRPATALLVVDVQNAAVAGGYQRDAVVANIGSLVEKARREYVPVIWVQHSDEELKRGSGDWQIVPELNPDGSEPLVEKHYGDSSRTPPWRRCYPGSASGGWWSSAPKPTPASARPSTAPSPEAMTRHWSATRTPPRTRPSGAAPPPDQVIAHTNLYWTYQTAPGRTAGTVGTKDVDFAAARPDA